MASAYTALKKQQQRVQRMNNPDNTHHNPSSINAGGKAILGGDGRVVSMAGGLLVAVLLGI
jgi:hypothetical protein